MECRTKKIVDLVAYSSVYKRNIVSNEIGV
jgi:hypothetical protein